MLTIYDLKNNVMLKQPDFFKLVEGFDTFEGVSFVGSFKIIEQELLPRFNQINLILGMEDQKTGKNLNQLLNVSNKVQQLLSVSSDFLERIEDQTLQLKFTKDELFHSKYFIVENDTDFIIFNGSMNLTQKALKHNHEMLWMYYGKKNNIQDLKIYEEHQKLFKKNFEEDSVDYLDRKIINNLYGKTKKQITAIIADEVVDKVQQNIVEVNPEDIIKVTKDAQRKEQTYELHPEIVQKVAKELFTEKGNKRRNEEKVREEIKQIIYQDFDDSSQNRVIKASELYPKLIWAYQDNEIITEDSNTNLFHTLNTNLDLVTKDDVRTFIRIIESFRLNKVKDESHQALSAFIYLMTAPMIWKIREIYRKSNFSKSADQIPLSMVLIGRGTTGKTLLVRDYFKKFIGDTSHSIQYTEINDGNASRTDKAVRFLDNYLHSARFISPMIVDELNSNFLHSKVALNAIKQWSNTITGIHNINIFAMNHNAGSKEINNLEEITKRVYYLSFEAPWLPTNQQEINYNILINDNNDHIYRYVVSELNKRLINLTGEEEAKLIDDYLSLTKDILTKLIQKYGYYDRLKDLLGSNYDYKIDRNRITWKMLILDDHYEHIAFTDGDDKYFHVSKAIFNDFKANGYENINQTLDNYFNMFPREAGIAIEQYGNGMRLDIDKFDKFIDEPLIRNHYKKIHKAETQQDDMKEFLKIQAQQTQMMQETMKKLAEQKEEKKKGLFTRLFKH
ncbi:phospholipase D family protein [Lactobacillus helveticus]|uniref:PLD phosphodiesterase domain-containing protein n=7 Tax=Lactobacillus TaxID=1578 RepID=A0A9Q5C5U2_LACHE|nr:phospholipase D family protein [Lactobacillus helveticus]NRN93771.1 hypothetical protein [Lactobacillus helveticus]NRO05532.1 hypothetical protein [Lactobacillus helveticus]NRO26692.1 hypothetical protein [Lactobacillus helveticus]NRO29976.1 hypothetical protein [Lactobacillus helveticus]NRO35577.1 hypothetical protein [Lactobacillus helveticus]